MPYKEVIYSYIAFKSHAWGTRIVHAIIAMPILMASMVTCNHARAQEFLEPCSFSSCTQATLESRKLQKHLIIEPLVLCRRDIKPENIFFSSDGSLKLGDFGLSVDLNEDVANTRVGTLDYMAPEVPYISPIYLCFLFFMADFKGNLAH